MAIKTTDSADANIEAEVLEESAQVSDNGGVVVISDPAQAAALGAFSSITGEDFESRLAVLKAVANPLKLADSLGKTINLRHIIKQPATFKDKKTGELREGHIVTLIDDDGTAYRAASKGIVNSVDTLLSIFGHPNTWGRAIPMNVTEEGTRPNQYFQINY